jgi:hypothetical protein
VYRGQLLLVTCIEPLDVLAVPSMDAVTPPPPTGAESPGGRSSGGHAAVHSVLVQVTFPPLSAVSMYSVLPSAFTRTVPVPLTFVEFTVAFAEDPPELGLDPAVVVPFPPQAATRRASSAPGITKRKDQ